MDIIDKLIKALPEVDEKSKTILSELLVKKFQEYANEKEPKIELTQEEEDDLAIQNYSGENHGEE